MSVASVGAYTELGSLPAALMDFNSRLIQVLFPALVERQAAGDLAGFREGLARAQRLALLVMVAPLTIGLGAGSSLMSLFGEEFENAGLALGILLAVPPLLNALVTTRKCAARRHNRPWTATILVVTRTTLILIMLPLLIPTHGLEGAAIALTGAHLVELALNTVVCHRQVPGFPHIRDLRPIRFLTVAAVASAAAAGIQAELGQAYSRRFAPQRPAAQPTPLGSLLRAGYPLRRFVSSQPRKVIATDNSRTPARLIAAFPHEIAGSSDASNPYLGRLTSALSDANVKVVQVKPRALAVLRAAERPDVFHVHWPEYMIRGDARTRVEKSLNLLRLVRVAAGFAALRLRAIPVVWTSTISSRTRKTRAPPSRGCTN